MDFSAVPWKILRHAVIQRDGRACRRCKTRLRLTVHHIKPRDEGGSDEPRNLITLCSPCHDWAEIATDEQGLSWKELLSYTRPDVIRVWYLDSRGVVCADIIGSDDEEPSESGPYNPA